MPVRKRYHTPAGDPAYVKYARQTNLTIQKNAADLEKENWMEEVKDDMPRAPRNDSDIRGGGAGMQPVPAVRGEAVPEASSFAGRLQTAQEALTYILAGNATVTIRSTKTGTRYTYQVRRADDSYKTQQAQKENPTWFVSLLTGPNNTDDFNYLGIVSDHQFRTTRKSKMSASSQPVRAFAWMLDKLVKGRMPQDAEIWHEGRCGRCNRKLTVPESIASGFGPECIQLVGGSY